MAKERAAVEKAPAELKTIEVLARERGTRPHVFAAVKEAAGWASGLRMTEDAYASTVEAWLSGAIGGR